MKKFNFLCLMAIMLPCMIAKAAVITVSNTPNSPGQYTSLQEAHDAANTGDTIYVSGSATTYGTIEVHKQLVIIGAGYNPNNQYNLKSEIQAIYFKMGTQPVNPTNPSGSTIKGFKIGSIALQSDNVNNINLARNEINSLTLYRLNSNWLIYNNIITIIQTTVSQAYSTNIIISNNIVNNSIRYLKSPTVLISNNIFTQNFTFTDIIYATIQNNIFYGGSTANCTYCTFNNNLSVGAANTFIYENNQGEDNLVNVDPMFENATNTTFNLAYDYHLKSASPGVNAGTDNTDMGIYGGMYPFPVGGGSPWITSPMPNIPQIISMIILNFSIPQNGTLEVQVSAKSLE